MRLSAHDAVRAQFVRLFYVIVFSEKHRKHIKV